MRTPDAIEDFPMRGNRYPSQVAPRYARLLVTKKVVEYFAARSRLETPWEFMQAPIPGNSSAKQNVPATICALMRAMCACSHF